MADIQTSEAPLYDQIHLYKITRESAEKAIKRLDSYIKSTKFGSSDHVLIQIRLEMLEDDYKKFVQYNDLLTAFNSELDKAEEIENLFIEVKAKLKYRLEFLCDVENYATKKTHMDKPKDNDNQNENEQDNKIQVSHNTELPHISLPTFEGYKSDYKAFAEAFTTKVAANSKLTESQKLHFLKSNLTGTPLELVTDSPTSTYTEALQILRRRYAVKERDVTMTEKPAHTAFLNIGDITEELYRSVVDGAHTHALEVSKSLSTSNHGAVITDVVKRLAQESNKNLLSYIYTLLHGDEKTVFAQLLPPAFQTVFSMEDVVFVHKKFGLALKLAAYTDDDNDREAWGDSKDKTSKRVTWKLVPIWENNRVVFKLRNEDCNMYLKLEYIPDDIGDRGAFGANDRDEDHFRNTWSLEPVVIDGEFLFFVVNRQFGQGLKLAEAEDDMKDRRLWGHNGDIYRDPNRFGWYINKKML